MKRLISLFIIALASVTPALADEGMWMVNDAGRKAARWCRSVVSIDFMGTGSLVSERGLVITNHHVALSDVHSLPGRGPELLESGFWAYREEDEIPIPGRKVQLLEGTVDVTAEVQALLDSGLVRQGVMMMRRLSSLMEKRYSGRTGLQASLSSAWKGGKYYMSLYREYSDVRLVGIPPVQIGAFGGDADNWEWPQHKGDFALLRIYTAPDGSPAEYSPDNVAFHSSEHLKISLRGYREGSRTTVIGFPGSTDRYASGAKVDYLSEVLLPIQTSVRGRKMEILRKWMDRDPELRRKYSNYFFSLSNEQELYLGELQCYKRFGVAKMLKEREERLAAWLDADPVRRAEWGDPASELGGSYCAVAAPQQAAAWFRECIIRGTRLEPVSSRCCVLGRNYSPERAAGVRRSVARDYSLMDLRVERELFRMCLETFMENEDPAMLGPFQTELRGRFGQDYDRMCAALWDCSWLTDPEQISEFLSTDMKAFLDAHAGDPLMRFFDDGKIVRYNTAIKEAQGTPDIGELSRNYTRALYAMQLSSGEKAYPDANSTMRVNFGRVKSLEPRDGVKCSYCSTLAGLLEKHDPDNYDFCIPDSLLACLKKAPKGMKLNFITDNDSTGGNSGSPVLNSRGEIIGLLFDGNKESLASEVLFMPGYNRSVNVDIRYVVWLLREYAGFTRILDELGLS